MSSVLRPGTRLGVYPQRLETTPGNFERVGAEWLDRMLHRASWRKYSLARVAARVDEEGRDLVDLDDAGLQICREKLRYELLRDGLEESLVFRAFALVREYAGRTLGMRHYDVQLLGGWVIVGGNMAEMATGEGKSLTATLAAATAALAGIPVHVITTNEYLAQRDAQEMRPLYQSMGLDVAVVLEKMGTAEKRQAYQSGIVYCTNKQVAFDYLRDRLVSRNESGRLSLQFGQANSEQQLTLRGLCFAILDEADSILIDEARTPLILSREHQDDSQLEIYRQALAVAEMMQLKQHYLLLPREHRLELTEAGLEVLHEAVRDLGGIWSGRRHSQFLVHQALCALHLYQRDLHYLVRAGRVEIIDQNTGRTMADRSWQQGLHQMIECKEDCALTGQRETLATISYQRFFRRYLRLGGMSGTLSQVSGELRSIYSQRVIPVPLHQPSRRRELGYRLCRRSQEKWLAVMARIAAVHASGQPVLVGTCSVRDSELLSVFLNHRKLPHQLLNARQDDAEASIIADAGQRGRITIATNMAGRGTDIKIGPGVAELGGLHVIACLHDSLVQFACPAWLRRRLGDYLGRREMPSWLARRVLRLAQGLMARRHRAMRRDVMQMDEKLGRMLAYTGRQE
jgi:preprotein translocase subunit SecA